MKLFLQSSIILGILLSAVAAYFSIGGLVLIFKGSPIAIIILAGLLEIGKVYTSVYLHIFWQKAKKLLITYLTFALIILATITSLGIFGALSSAYFNSTDTSEYTTKVNNIKAKIDIENNRITNINTQIAAISSIPKEDKQSWHYWKINSLSKDIKGISDNIDKLNDELIPYKTKINIINSEVGPLKYLAEWIYGETENSIDKAVQLFIVMLVVVFDPLALLLIFAGIHGIHIIEEEEKEKPIVETKIEKTLEPEEPEEVEEPKEEVKKRPTGRQTVVKQLNTYEVESFDEQVKKPETYKADIKNTKKSKDDIIIDEDVLSDEEVEESISDLDKELKKIKYIK